MLLHTTLPALALTAFILPIQTFMLNPYDQYDSYYDSAVRNTLSGFHPNLSQGRYAANGPMVSLGMQWNVNGQLLVGRGNFVKHLLTFNTSFHGLQAPDLYHVVDGHVGASFYHLQGKQTGPLGDLPDAGRMFDIMGAELMDFDTDALLNVLYTIEEMGTLGDQITGVINVTQPVPVTLKSNPQTSPDFRTGIRQTLKSLHDNFNLGKNGDNAKLVTANVTVRADTAVKQGQTAFVDLYATWQKAFPDMLYHDDYILADGHLGAIEYVWEGTQTSSYVAPNGTTVQPTGKTVRVRGLSAFEFTDDGLIDTVVNVHDEAVIVKQLMGQPIDALYP